MGWTRDQAIDFFREYAAKTTRTSSLKSIAISCGPAKPLATKWASLKYVSSAPKRSRRPARPVRSSSPGAKWMRLPQAQARAPYLDHRVVELAWRIPHEMKIRPGREKWILSRVLDRYVPRQLIDRPKMGFGVPIGAWLRGPLREWAEDLLGPAALAEGGLLHPAPIRQTWTGHLSGIRDRPHHLWAVLMFQAWRRTLAPAPRAHLAAGSSVR